jgi:Fe-Mn family superoxide dismutase
VLFRSPLSEGSQSIIGCDVWEHSYYIDYRNNRLKYLTTWFENLIDWDFVANRLKETL